MKKKLLTDAASIFAECAETLRVTKGEFHANALLSASDAVADLVRIAEQAKAAKDLYYSQRVTNTDALDNALTAWADRMDDLQRAVDQLEGVPARSET